MKKKKEFLVFQGVTNYFGTYSTEKNNLSFSQMGSARKMCPNMTIENTFINNLKSVSYYKIENEKLNFFGKNDELMISCELADN